MAIIKDTLAAVSGKGLKYESSQELDELELDEQGIVDPSVPAKYRGTATDKRDMHTLGKVQVLRVSTETARMLDRRSASSVSVIFGDLADNRLFYLAQFQIRDHAGLCKHGHLHLGDSTIVRPRRPLLLVCFQI